MKRCLKKIMENFRLKLSVLGKDIVVLSIFALSISLVNAKTVYVNFAQANDNGDGTTWANAKKNIQAGIDLAQANDVIHIANGTYSSSATINIAKGPLIIKGGWNLITGTPVHQPFQAGTIVRGNNASTVLLSLESTAEGLTVEGVTFRDYATAAADDYIIKTALINVKFKNCIFTNNTKTVTTGQTSLIMQPIFSDLNKRVVFSGCSFINNETRSGCFLILGNDATSGYDFENCVFANNSGSNTNDGSVITLAGSFPGCSSTIKNCTFVNNLGAAAASSIKKSNASALAIINTVFFSINTVKPQIVSTNPDNFSITNCYVTADGSNAAGGELSSNLNFGTIVNSYYLSVDNTDLPGFVGLFGTAGYGKGSANDNFSLTNESILITAGTSNGAPTHDIVNVVRTDPPSVGAYQGSYSPAGTSSHLFVHGADGNDNNDGLSWGTAKKTIEGALVLSPSEVWVTTGTYTGLGTGNAYIVASGVKMYGGFSGNETEINQRNLANKSKLNKTSSENTRILLLIEGLSNTSRTIVDGFEITGGNLSVDAPGEVNVGAGVFMNNFTTLSNCTVKSNFSITGGGGIYMKGDSLVDKCIIQSNSLVSSSGFTWRGQTACGGGVLMNSTSATIKNSSVLNNNSGQRDAAGIGSLSGNIINCVISENITSRAGGGIYASGTTNIVNCLINNNTAGSTGGGIRVYRAGNPTTKIINCTIVKNTASTSDKSGGVYSGGSNTSAANTVIWGNMPESYQWEGDGTRTNCASDDSSIPSNNIILSKINMSMTTPLGPSFVDPANGNYQFNDESPLRNTGSDALYTTGDVNSDKDLAGNLRKISTSIDIGAYESTSTTKLTYIPNFSSRVLPTNSPAFTITNLPTGATVSYSVDGTNYQGTFPANAGRYSVKINITSSTIYTEGDYFRDFWLVTNHAHVSATGGNNYGTGTGWGYAIHKDAIVDALNVSNNKILWIAGGDYNITKRILSNVTGKTLIGGFAGTEADATSRSKVAGGKAWQFTNQTNFFGPQDGIDAQMFAIAATNVETSFDGISFTGKSERTLGGGILETAGPVKLINCVFEEGKSNNSSNGGGAIFAYGTGSFDISGCLFERNTSKAGGGAIDIEGNGTLAITNSKVLANTATGAGGGINIRGSVTATITDTEVFDNTGGVSALLAGGVHADTSSKIIITGCHIYGNRSLFGSSNHGGITINGSGDVDIIKTRVIKNSGGTNHGGGAIVIGSTGVTNIINSIIANNGNITNFNGAGILSANDASKIKVINCVVAYNNCGGGSQKNFAVEFGSGGQNELINTIVWGNTNCKSESQVGGTYSVQGSAVQGLISLGVYELNTSNTAANGPNFVSVAGVSGSAGYDPAANWELTSISPCIDKGVIITGVTPTEDILGYDRPKGLGNDIGSYEFFLKTIYVKTSGNDNDSGMNWASAKKTLQGALAIASSGDQIWMAEGVYNIAATQAINKSVSIFGSFVGTEDSQAQRIKSQNSTWSFVNQTDIIYKGTQFILSANDIRLDGLRMLTSSDVILNGFSLSEGAVSVGNFSNIIISNCIITGFWPWTASSKGAGININGGSVIVENTLIKGNQSKSNGSGINIITGNHIIRGCKISENRNTEANGNGGGINVTNGVVSIEDTSIDSNYVIGNSNTGSDTGIGGGISVFNGTVTIRRCKISNNRAKTNAAGIHVAGGNVLVQSSLISNNYLGTTANTNLNTAFAGGGFYLIEGAAVLENCTIVNNHCGNGNGNDAGGGICQRTAGSIYATNCLVWGNINGTTSVNVSGLVTLTNCAVTGAGLTLPSINLNSSNDNESGPNFKLISNNAGFDSNWEQTNWGLEDASICNDKGIVITTITKDIIGIPVPQGSAPEIGAYETVANGGNFLTFNNLEQEILNLTPVTTSPVNGTISYYPSVTDAETGTNNILFANLKPGKWRVKAVVSSDPIYGSETAYADLYINENFDVKIGQDVLYVSLGKKEAYGEILLAGYGESWANPLSKKLLVKALDYANLKVCVSNGTYDSVPTIMIPAGKTLEGGWLITNGVGTRDLVEESVFGDKVTIYPWEFKNPTIIKQSVKFQNAVIDLNGGTIDGITVQDGRCGVVLKNNGKIYNSIITNNQGNAGTGSEYKGIGVSVETNSAGNLIESSFIYDNKHLGGGNGNHAAAGIGLNADAAMFVAVKNSMIAKNKSTVGTGGMTTGKNSNPIILNCIFVNNESSAGSSDTISSGGIGRHSDNASNVRIENCTIVYNKTSATGNASFGGVSLGGDGSNFKNNIVWGNVGGQGKSQSQQSGANCAIQEMAAASVNLAIINDVETGPNFFNVAGTAGVDGYSFGADWRISDTSPCLDKTAFAAATTTDILGVNRQSAGGAQADIGAYERIYQGAMYLTFHNLVQYKDHVSPVYTSPIESTISYYKNAADALNGNGAFALPAEVGRYRVKAVLQNAKNGYPATEEYADLIIIDNVPENKDDLYVVDVSLIPYGIFTGAYGESWGNPIAGTLLQEAMSKAKKKIFLSEGNFSIASTLNVGIGKVLEGGYNMENKKRDLLTTSEVSSINGIIYSWEFKKKSILSSKTRLSPMVSVNGILDGVLIENGGRGVTLNVGATLMNSVVKGNNERGIYVTGANTKILNNYITENSNENQDGAGIYVNATTTITGCVISKNFGKIGGGLFLNAAATVTDCIIAANMVGSDQGGAVKVHSGASSFVNCLVANNESSNSGGYAPGFDVVAAGCSITNCSFVMNKCLNGSGAEQKAGTSIFARENLTVTNSLFFGGNSTASSKAEITGWGGATTLQNCAFGSLGTITHSGTINNNNPITPTLTAISFETPATTAGVAGYSSTNNWQLTIGSPCINSGINAANVKSDILGVARPIGSSYDVGAYEYFTTADSYLVLHNLIQVENNITGVYTTPVAAGITYYADAQMTNSIDLPSTAGRYYVKAEVTTTKGIFGAVVKYADLIINGNYQIPTDQDDLYVSVEGKLGYGEFSDNDYGKSWDNPIIGSQSALISAISNAKKKIYIAGGTYNISSLISLPAGKTIEGGYNPISGLRNSATKSEMGSLLPKPSAVIYSWEFESPTIFNATSRLSPVIDLFGTLNGVTVQNGANGVWAKSGSTVTRSIIQNNEGNPSGGNIQGAGIGIRLFGNVTVRNSLVFGNRSLGNEGSGGIGYGRSDAGTSNIYGSAVIANNGSSHGGSAVGGQTGTQNFYNCLFSNNAGSDGVILTKQGGNINVYYSTIVNNNLNISVIVGGSISLNNCLAYGNNGSNSAGTINNCYGQIGTAMINNPFAETSFTTVGIPGTPRDAITKAYWGLNENATCIDKGTSAGIQPTDIAGIARPLGNGYDVGAYEYVPNNSKYMAFHNLNQKEGNVIPVITSPSATNIQYYLNMEDAVLGVNGRDLPTSPGVYVVKAIMFNNANFPDIVQYANLMISPLNNLTVSIAQNADRLYVTLLGGDAYGAVSTNALTGNSWELALPATHLQNAINAVNVDGEIWISFGTYFGASNGPGFIMRDDVSVYGGFYGDEANIGARQKRINGNAWEFDYETILSGANPLGNSYSVVKFPEGTRKLMLLNGVTIENGYANVTGNNTGGGVYLTSNGVVDSCIIRNNRSSSNGGGIFINGGEVLKSLIQGNSADFNSSGGGLSVATNTSTDVDSCFIVNNNTSGGGKGGGIHLAQSNTNSEVLIINSLIAHNNTGSWGAGICADIVETPAAHNANFRVVNCSIVRNLTTANEDSRTGAQGVNMINTVIWGNVKVGNAVTNNQFYACATTNCAYSSGNIAGSTASGRIELVESTNPGFTSAAQASSAGGMIWLSSWDYSISSMASLLYNAGLAGDSNSYIPDFDILETIRPQGSKWDIGAYELIVDKIKPIYAFANLVQQKENNVNILAVTATIQNMTTGFEDPSTALTVEYATITDGVIGTYLMTVPNAVGTYKVKITSPETANFLEKIFILDMIIMPESDIIYVTSNVNDTTNATNNIGTEENPLLAKFFVNAVNLPKVKTINLFSGSLIETANDDSTEKSTVIIDRGMNAELLVIDGATTATTRAVNTAETSIIRTNSPNRRIFEVKSSVTFKNIIFDGGPNQSFDSEGAGLLFHDGNVGSIGFENCIIRNCATTGNGGGLAIKSGTDVKITNSSFLLNQATDAAAINFAMTGGNNPSITLRNTFISGNHSQSRSNNVVGSNQPVKIIGAIFDNNTGVALNIANSGETHIINCTFVKNESAINAVAAAPAPAPATAYVKIINSIFWGNTFNFSVGGNGFFSSTVYDVKNSAIQGLPSGLITNGAAKNNNVALSSVNGGDSYYRGPVFKAPANDIGTEGYSANNSWRITDYSEALLNKGLEDDTLNTTIPYYTDIGVFDIYGDARIGTDQDSTEKLDIGAAEKGSRSSTPAIDVEVAYKGEVFSWSVGVEIGVAYYNIIDAKTGKIVATIMATGESHYEIIVPEGMDLYLQIIDINGFSQDFAPGDKTIGRIIYNLKQGWNLIAVPFANADISELANVSGNLFWKFEDGIYSQHSMEINSIEPMKGIWIYCEYQRQIEISGKKLSIYDVELQSGWNLLGPTNNILAPINVEIIFGWNNQYEEILKDTGVLIQGQGYWFFATEKTIIKL